MKVIIPIILFVVLCWLLYKAVSRIAAWGIARHERIKQKTALWELEEDSDGEFLNIYAVRNAGTPREERLLVAGEPFAHSDFAQRIENARAYAELEKLPALNGSRKRLHR